MVVPATLGQVQGIEYAVTGETAASKDWNDAMRSAVPVVFAFVLAFAFLLLLVSFRSVVIPLKAIVMNLLSVAAAYGVVVAIFQWGWGESLLDFNSNGGVASWLPMFLFVILFGLSMDYHVFILSRIREYYDRGMSTEDAVSHGIKATAGVVTSAAAVMVLVFGVFALMPIIDMKEMGIGLAAAILIDATIVRGVLLPATMKLLGRWNWYLPRWLEWLPRLEHERSVDPAPQQSCGLIAHTESAPVVVPQQRPGRLRVQGGPIPDEPAWRPRSGRRLFARSESALADSDLAHYSPRLSRSRRSRVSSSSRSRTLPPAPRCSGSLSRCRSGASSARKSRDVSLRTSWPETRRTASSEETMQTCSLPRCSAARRSRRSSA